MSLPGSHPPDRDNHFHSLSYSSMQAVTDSGMPMHMFPLTSVSTTIRSKRKQVKNACTNCQKACKKCDECRPCLRCVKYGHPDQCVDSQRKERKKGVKRGKYKKRDGKGPYVEQVDSPFVGIPLVTGEPSPAADSPAAGEAYPDVGFEPSYYYGHYPSAIPKSNTQMFCTDYYQMQEPTTSSHPAHRHDDYVPHQIQDHGQRLYDPVSTSYSTPVIQYPHPQAPYMQPVRPDPSLLIPQPTHFYPSPVYAKPPNLDPHERLLEYDGAAYR